MGSSGRRVYLLHLYLRSETSSWTTSPLPIAKICNLADTNIHLKSKHHERPMPLRLVRHAMSATNTPSKHPITHSPIVLVTPPAMWPFALTPTASPIFVQ